MTYTEDFRQIEVKLRLAHEIDKLKKEVQRSDSSIITEISLLSDRLEEFRRGHDGNRKALTNAIQRFADIANLELGELTVTYDFGHGQKITSRGGTMFTLTDIQKVHATPDAKDSRGNEAEFDATQIQWSSSDPSKVSVTPDTDGSGGATFEAVGPLTDPAAPVQVTLTDGTLTVTDTIAVTSSAATSVGITFGQAEDSGNQPAPAPTPTPGT
jgi:hypothetical protein